MRIEYSCTRTVFLIGKFAIKVPTGRYSFSSFLRGLIGNISEKNIYRSCSGEIREAICPIVFTLPLGLCVVMLRCSPLEPEETPDFIKLTHVGKWVLPCEHKIHSFGRLNGKIVAIDYGDHPHGDYK